MSSEFHQLWRPSTLIDQSRWLMMKSDLLRIWHTIPARIFRVINKSLNIPSTTLSIINIILYFRVNKMSCKLWICLSQKKY